MFSNLINIHLNENEKKSIILIRMILDVSFDNVKDNLFFGYTCNLIIVFMNPESQNSNLSGELDLFSIISWLKNILKKHKKVTLGFLLSFFLLGLVYYIFVPKIFKARMVASSTILKGSAFIVVMDDLQRHIAEGNFEEVARLLNVDSLTASKINKIQVFSSKNFTEKEFSDKITEAETEAENTSGEFIIEAFVYDNTKLPLLQNGLIYYLSNNEYTKVKSKQKKDNLRQVVSKIHDQLSQLDTMKNSLSDIFSGKKKNKDGTNSNNLLISDPSSIYNNVLELFKSEIYTNAEIAEPDIMIIQGFISYTKPSSPKLILVVFISLVLGSLSAGICIFYLETKGKF